MSNDPAADTIAHFRAGFDVIKQYPIMALPPLGAQAVVFVLTLLFFGGAATAVAVAGGAGFLGALLGGLLLWLVSGLLTLVASAVTVVMARDALDGREPSFGDAVSVVMGRLADVVGASVLFGLIVFVASLFFVIPGLIAAFFLMFTLPAVLIEGAGAIDSLGRSARLVRQNLGPALGLVIGVILVAVALGIVFAVLGNVPLLGQLASAVLVGVFAAYIAVVAVRVFRLLPVR
jgi:hypothetical protein